MLTELEQLADRLLTFERGFRSFEALASRPFFTIDRVGIECFRYGKPGLGHFLFLHFGQMASNMNAILTLYPRGFGVEIMGLCRFMFEAETKIRFMMSGLNEGKLDRKQARFLSRFFADNFRDPKARNTAKVPAPQRQIIEENAKSFREDLDVLKEWRVKSPVSDDDVFDIFHSLNEYYKITSNYIHGRYPELMQYYEPTTNLFQTVGVRDALTQETLLNFITLNQDRNVQLLSVTGIQLLANGLIDKDHPYVKWAVESSQDDAGLSDLLRKILFPTSEAS